MMNELSASALQMKSIRLEERQADFVASTDAMDADGDIVEQNWDLERYLKNPVVLFGHSSKDLPIGHATNVSVKDGQLQATIVFASAKANPMAEQVWQSVQERTLRAVSVGFKPREVRQEMRNDKDVYVLSDNELYEISVVPIPSNPEALTRMKAMATRVRDEKEEKDLTADKADDADDRKFDLTPPRDREQTADGGKERKAMELEKAVVELESMKAQLVLEEEKVETLNKRCMDLEEERNEYRKQADTLRVKSIEKTLDDLIGVKIAPTEKDTLIKLATQSPELFEEHLKAIESRPDMNILKSVVEDVIGEDPTPKSLSAGDTSGVEFEALVKQLGA